MRVRGRRNAFSLFVASAAATFAFAQVSALDIALEAFRSTADLRDAGGAMRAAEIHMRLALGHVNAIAGGVAIRDVDPREINERASEALREIGFAKGALSEGVWTADAEGFPWDSIHPLLPPPANDYRDPNQLNSWMLGRMTQVEFAISAWLQGKIERDVIFAAQHELGRLHLVITRAVSAQNVPPLPEAR